MAERDFHTGNEGVPRRTVLKTGSAIGLSAAVAGIVGAQEGGEAQQEPTTVVFGGQTEYWYGIAPAAIQGQENPMLELQTGTQYEVVWIGIDDAEHEFVIEDANDSNLAESPSAAGVGETASVQFEATEAMDEYYCEYHPRSMRGAIETVQSGGLGTQETTGTDAGTATETGTETETSEPGY